MKFIRYELKVFSECWLNSISKSREYERVVVFQNKDSDVKISLNVSFCNGLNTNRIYELFDIL